MRPHRHPIAPIVLVGAALVGFMTAGGWLWHYLSQHPVRLATPPPAAEPSLPAHAPPTDANINETAKLKALLEPRMAELDRLQRTLREMRAEEWSGQEYAALMDMVQKAEELMLRSNYRAASDAYEAALGAASRLVEQSQKVLLQLLQEGQLALDNGDGPGAERSFARALQIDHQNPQAQQGVEKAQTLAQVQALIASGQEHENQHELTLALTDYQQALRLNPSADKARRAAARIEQELQEKDFRKALAAGVAALHRGDHQQARKSLEQARRLSPGDQALLDALAQLKTDETLHRIQALQRQAKAAEKAENWPDAVQSYRKLMALDANLQFAQKGLNHAREQLHIVQHLGFYLAQPEVLSNDRHLANAQMLLAQAHEKVAPDARIQSQLHQLEHLVERARTPVRVVLVSDAQTNVAVYKIGKLGRFINHELTLRPGTYTVVGTRSGYQDVRKTIRVTAEQTSLQVTIQCVDRI